MNMRTFIRTYALLLLGVVAIILLVWLWGYKTNLPAPENRSDADFITAIGKTNKELFTSDGQPIFTIKNTKKSAANWYVLKLVLKEGEGPESFIIINDLHFGSEYMAVVAGPESKFSFQELLESKILIPGRVIDTLKSEGAL